MKISKAIIAYKAGSQIGKVWAERCSCELENLGVKVLIGPTGATDNPYPVFLESMHQDIDLAIVLGGDGATLGAAARTLGTQIERFHSFRKMKKNLPNMVEFFFQLYENLQASRRTMRCQW